jgi:signal transduction histidine kinase
LSHTLRVADHRTLCVSPRMLLFVKWLLSSAVLLALGMVAAGMVAGRTLRQRDAAVREGVLLRAAHELERELRESGPDAASNVLDSFLAGSTASAVELHSDGRLLARAGTAQGAPLETPLFLGPGWRGMAGGMGIGMGIGMGRGQPPFRLRIWPAPGVGDSTRIAAIATWGSITAALALLAFATIAARGVAARQRAVALDAERQRLEIVSTAGAGLAHRIRNPLATIKATAQLLAAQSADAQRERATRIVDASVRIESLVDELLTFAKPVDVHAEPIDLGSIAGTSEHVMVRADREHVTAALEELIANARNAGDPDPKIVVRRMGRYGTIEVHDRGTGLQIEVARAFDPYMTTRPDGTGLGLPTIRALIRANGGDVTLNSREGGGAVAAILLPAVSA